jgi:hypothetical protein
MTSFPRIQHPCPYLDRLDAVVDDGFCRMCRRDVHDLTGMDGQQRADFVAGRGDACVSYTLNVKPAVAAALIAASAAVLVAPAAASAKHPASRAHHHHPSRTVQIPTVLMRTAGVPAPFGIDAQAEPRRPAAPPPPARKPD